MRFPLACGALLIAGISGAAGADVIVSVVPEQNLLSVGQSTMVNVYADITGGDFVTAWGLDIASSELSVGTLTFSSLGPSWTLGPNPDGDGFTGFNLSGISGNNVLLASFEFTALSEGVTFISLSQTLGDPTELFQGQCPETPTLQGATISVVPAPGAATVLAGLGLCALRRRRA